jgi:8-amino-7-oxononanoate synthase
MSLEGRWRRQLEQRHGEDRLRRLQLPAGIDFSSNDYLGYAARTWAPAPLSRSGSASRLLRGHHAVWEEVEAELARWHRTEAVLVFTSGYAANEGLLGTIVQPHDFVASDECNHASIIDGLRLSKAERFVFRHNDLDRLEGGLREAARKRPPDRQLFIVTESLFGMEGDVAPLTGLAELARRYDAALIVDEAHATGCFGAIGGGLVDQLGLRDTVLATVHTGGKALGVPGAYVAGSRLLKEYLVNHCRHFIFTTALPPQVGRWWLDAATHVQADHAARQRLHSAAAYFRRCLALEGVYPAGAHYIVPIVLGDDPLAVTAARHLQTDGYDIRAIRPPTVTPGTARLRISIHSDHAAEVLQAVARAVARVSKGDRLAERVEHLQKPLDHARLPHPRH